MRLFHRLFFVFLSFWIGVFNTVQRQAAAVFQTIRDVAVKSFYPKQATKIPVLAGGQLSMRSYYKRLMQIPGAIVLSMSGFFVHKMAVNMNA